MDCKETRKNINRFIEDGLEDNDLAQFIKHISECEECKEELSIQYLVTTGMKQLEEDSAFDLYGDLKEKMERATRRVQARKRAIAFMYVMETIAILAVILMTIMVILK